MTWQPIETAGDLRDYEKVDLWVRHPDGNGHREANAYRAGRYWNTRDGYYVEGRAFVDHEGERRFDPDDRGPDAKVATHWQPLPEPPSARMPTMDKPIDLTDFEARAAQDGRLGMLIRPLDTQPPEDLEFYGVAPSEPVVKFIDTAMRFYGYDLPFAAGDRLWAREEWAIRNAGCKVPAKQTMLPRVLYLANVDRPPNWTEDREADTMPRWASRFTLEVVSVTVKRLQDVTFPECRQAGGREDYKVAVDCAEPNCTGFHYGEKYDLMNHWPHQPPWAENPWCAFVELRKV